MSKDKVQFECSHCGQLSAKWLGVCPSCDQWNTFKEVVVRSSVKKEKHKIDISQSEVDEISRLSEISDQVTGRFTSNISELDRVLGGGFVKGSFMLLGGDPGIGKSTLMLQAAKQLPDLDILYIAGEESATQIKQRAQRMDLTGENLYVSGNTEIREVVNNTRKLKPGLLIIDSIQTLFSSSLTSLPGSIQQIRECSAILQQLAKKEGFTTLMIGHVTKDGEIAGPKILEHTVDTVLHFEGDKDHLYRLLRCVKNRFGPAQEVGVFEMSGSGLKEVTNPSKLFISDPGERASGSATGCIMEGTRPILIEVQALAVPSSYGTPQRTASGFDQRRLSLLLAVLEKRANLSFAGSDVYLNIAGGLKVTDPAADLAVVAALASSLKNREIPADTIFIGEVGLGGEIRKVSFAEQRLKEAGKMGITTAVTSPLKWTGGSATIKSARWISEIV
ncbi:MAG TPA: DNA repair protein RadA [Balneolaceae bacterium]|nr:DNA repair protein RadA [Balneolaceae bacterium]